MSGITTEILFLILLAVANGVFSMAESAIVASRKARLQQAAEEGSAKARAALELAESPNRFLATVQIGITLIGILSGAFGGARLSKSLSAAVAGVPALAPYADSIGFGVVVLAITYLSLVIGELVPKRLALHSPERIASLVALPMRSLSVIAAPVVTVLSFSTDVILRIFGLKASSEPPVTEEEIQVMIEQGTQAGVFDAAEQAIVTRVFRLGDRRVESLMTRRPDIIWLDLEDPWSTNKAKIAASVYSRLPVCRGGLDHVLGIVRAKDLLGQCLADPRPASPHLPTHDQNDQAGNDLIPMADLPTADQLPASAPQLPAPAVDLLASLQPAVFIPETLPALKLLASLNAGRTHIALVIDEHGATQGLVTLQDILGAIVGDLPNVDASDEPDAVQREDGSWLLDGLMPITDFKHLFRLSALPGEAEGNYTTLSGFIMSEIGRIPAASEHFTSSGLRFEIIDMDGHRIDKVLVAAVSPVAPGE